VYLAQQFTNKASFSRQCPRSTDEDVDYRTGFIDLPVQISLCRYHFCENFVQIFFITSPLSS